MLIDSHCHLDFPELQEDFDGVIQRAVEAGVEKMMTISTRMAEIDKIIKIAESNDRLYCTIGTHPHHVANPEEAFDQKRFLELADHPKVIGIGETGLDYFYDTAPRDVQKKAFEQHLEICLEKDLPVIIHTREAEDDTWEILEKYAKKGPLKGILHCFTSKDWLADKGVEIGFMISMSGIVTFKKSHDLQALAKRLPLAHLLVETDAPYLAPVPKRGKPNEPSYVKYTAAFLAELRGENYDDFCAATSQNFMKLFSL